LWQFARKRRRAGRIGPCSTQAGCGLVMNIKGIRLLWCAPPNNQIRTFFKDTHTFFLFFLSRNTDAPGQAHCRRLLANRRRRTANHWRVAAKLHRLAAGPCLPQKCGRPEVPPLFFC
jgi:hypothetical protein